MTWSWASSSLRESSAAALEHSPPIWLTPARGSAEARVWRRYVLNATVDGDPAAILIVDGFAPPQPARRAVDALRVTVGCLGP